MLILRGLRGFSEHGELRDSQRSASDVRPIGNRQPHITALAGREFVELRVPGTIVPRLIQDCCEGLAVARDLYLIAEGHASSRSLSGGRLTCCGASPSGAGGASASGEFDAAGIHRKQLLGLELGGGAQVDRERRLRIVFRWLPPRAVRIIDRVRGVVARTLAGEAA